MSTSNKLYRVTLQGMTTSTSRPTYGVSFVVATDPNEAFTIVRKFLDGKELGFDFERELKSVELIAEASAYADCGTILFGAGAIK